MKLRRYTAVIVCLAALVQASANIHAQNTGDVIGNIYSTDIVAYIDDMPIRSYNIGGRTVIAVEDLRDYGFDVEWNETCRILDAEVKQRPDTPPEARIEKQVPGNVVGNIYYTDIEVYINGVDYYYESYNIGGITCVAIEDLAVMDVTEDQLLRYSTFGMRYVYDNNERSIRLYTLRSGDSLMTKYGEARINEISASYTKNEYKYTNDKNENYLFIICSMFMSDRSKWSKYVNIDTLPEDSGISGKTENGAYYIECKENKIVDFSRYSSSNGAIHNSNVMLSLILPMYVNGEMIYTDEPNCIFDLISSDYNYGEIYISEEFLENYVGYVWNEV